jgi:hypothetical protein
VSELALARSIVASFVPRFPEQAVALQSILEFVDRHPDALLRSCAVGHLTASALIVSSDRQRALLMHHRKVGRWLQTGGHADGEGDLRLVATNEAAEESGIEGLVVTDAPVDLDVHRFVAPGEATHLHHDVRYMAAAPEGAVEVANEESLGLRWFTLAEIDELGVDVSTLRLARLALQDS